MGIRLLWTTQMFKLLTAFLHCCGRDMDSADSMLSKENIYLILLIYLKKWEMQTGLVDWADGDLRQHLTPIAKYPWSQWNHSCPGIAEQFNGNKNQISETIHRFDGNRSCLMILCLPLDFNAEGGSQSFNICLIFEVELPENLTGPKLNMFAKKTA